MRRTLTVAAMCLAGSVQAQAVQVQGYVDVRAAAPAGEASWLDGGLGKTRFGDGDDAFSGAAAMSASWQATPALLASASVQYQPELRHSLDVLEAYVRYRPVSTTPWRWSVKAGAFFPHVSLEHDGIAWSTTRTLTPSALNTWVGEELRTFGAEAQVEHRGSAGTFEASVALFGKNDPAGELLATRGWAMGDIVPGIDGSLRQPDVHAPVVRAPLPLRFRPFVETDDRPGWHASLGWKGPTRRASLMYYDNRADLATFHPYAGRNVRAWRTRFWNAGAEQALGEWTVLGQAMHGSTAFEPVAGRVMDTAFNAGYLMFARDAGTWRPALRVDLFQARVRPRAQPSPLSEHGHAVTIALNWRPHARLRVTGEWLRIDSTRDQRLRAGLAPRQVDTQVQLGARWFF
jgi:hypothetical protein